MRLPDLFFFREERLSFASLDVGDFAGRLGLAKMGYEGEAAVFICFVSF